MLKTALCVILAVTAATAWQGLASVPSTAEVQDGSAITYGNGKVWGIFPNEDDDCTYFMYYDLNYQGGPQWVYPGEDFDLDYLENTAITFQWTYGGRFFVVGNDDGDADYPTLYTYDLVASDWDDEEDLSDYFYLGAGASIAFRPASGWYGTYVAGWLYCLAGDGREFWCRGIPGPGDVTFDGICPGETALIADKTPHFSWQGPPAGQYRLMISTDPNFTATGLDTVVSATQCDVPNPMDNGTYYWRTGTQNGQTWAWSSTHSFVLDGDWTPLTDIPVSVGDGAAMAYERDLFGHQSILALPGGESNDFWEYDIVAGDWNQKGSTTIDEIVGTSLVTHEATEEAGITPWCAFGGSGTSDYLWYYGHFGWAPWNGQTVPTFPQWIGPGSSMAYGLDHYVYLIVGEDENGDPRNDFYRQQLPWTDGGPQAAATLDGKSPARVISRFDGISVRYQLRAPSRVRATLHDVSGRLVGELDAGEQMTGSHRLDLSRDADGRRLASGAYFVLLDMGSEQARLKAVIQ